MSKISNKKIEVSNGTSMNEKDYLTLCLSHLKDTQKNLCIALTEASNEKLYKIIYKMFENISMLQRKVYEIDFRCGWYELESLDSKKINDKYKKLSQEFNLLS